MPSPRQSRRANILVVDDKYPNLLALEAVLGRDNNVLFANNGAEAIEMVRSRRDVDLVLMDVQMPQMDGFETARRIKALPGCEDLPIVFVTAVHSEDPFVKRGFEVGGLDYFTKPFDPELLKLKVGIYTSYRLRGEELRAQERRLHELAGKLGRIPVGVIITGTDGRIAQLSEAAGRVLNAGDGYGFAAPINGWWQGDGRSFASPDGALDRALRLGESTLSEHLTVRCLDGAEKNLFVAATPLYAPDGRITGAALLIGDSAAALELEADWPQLAQAVEEPASH